MFPKFSKQEKEDGVPHIPMQVLSSPFIIHVIIQMIQAPFSSPIVFHKNKNPGNTLLRHFRDTRNQGLRESNSQKNGC